MENYNKFHIIYINVLRVHLFIETCELAIEMIEIAFEWMKETEIEMDGNLDLLWKSK